MSRKNNLTRNHLFIIGVLAAMLVAAYFDIAFCGKTLKLTTANPQALFSGVYGQQDNKLAYFPVHSTDSVTFEEPILRFVGQSLRAGIFPFWNPHQACGYPLIGMMQVGLFWPLHAFVYFLPQAFGWDIMMFFRYLLAGYLLYCFMRTLRYRCVPSLGAAVTFMLSGPMVLSHWAFVNTDILIPLLLLSQERLIRKPGLRQMLLLSTAVFFMFLAGHPEHLFLAYVFASLYLVFRLATVRQRGSVKRVLSVWVAGNILGVGMSSFVLFPFLSNWLTEFWHSHPKTLGPMAEAASLNKEALLTFLMPTFFQKEVVTLNFSRYSFWGWLGVIPLGFVFLSFFSVQRRRLNVFFAALAIIIFVKSHLNTPINYIGYLPLFNLTRFYHHTAHIFAMVMAILTGMGIRVFLARPKTFLKSVGYAALVTFMIAGGLLYCRNAEHFDLSCRAAGLAGVVLVVFLLLNWLKDKRVLSRSVAGILVLAALLAELSLYIPRERARRFDSFPKVPYIELIKSFPDRSRSYGIFWAFYPNTASGYQVDDLGVVHGFLFRRYVSFVNDLMHHDYFKKDYGSSSLHVMPFNFQKQARPYLDLLNVRFVVSPPFLEKLFAPSRSPEFPQPLYDQEVKLFYDRDALPRAFIVHQVVFAQGREELVAQMTANRNRFAEVAVIEGDPDPAIEKALSGISEVAGSSAEITSYSPNRVIVQAHSVQPGVLVLGDAFHPDWVASVDGERTPIFFTNYLMRSVFLPQGEHTVRFVFRPRSFYAGCVASLALWGCFGFLFCFSRGKRPRQRKKSMK